VLSSVMTKNDKVRQSAGQEGEKPKRRNIKTSDQYINIPRTGIEQPFLLSPPSFIRESNDFERINEISMSLKLQIIEEYRMRDKTRVINLAKTVYDCEKDSPHYRSGHEYINPVH
jgi:hypothetical protein